MGDQKTTARSRSALPQMSEPSWEETHQRVTFYCPRALIDVIEAEMNASSRSKSQVIVDALRQHLEVTIGDG